LKAPLEIKGGKNLFFIENCQVENLAFFELPTSLHNSVANSFKGMACPNPINVIAQLLPWPTLNFQNLANQEEVLYFVKLHVPCM
jgi:hypothetical protein